MSWIKTVSREAADGRLKSIYDRVAGPDGQIDNILASHSLRPHTLEGHMALYKATLHHFGNALSKTYLETIGTYVSGLNNCTYCVEHHFAGLVRLLGDGPRSDAIRAAIEDRTPDGAPLDARERAAMAYARKLTETPALMVEGDVAALRAAGWEDGEILEINQVCAYFSYANRTVLGLGCSTDGDVLGLSPGNSEDPDDWGHR